MLAQTKCNLAPSLYYEIEPVEFDDGSTSSRIRWVGPAEYSAEDLMLAHTNPRDEALQEAKEFLLELLANGPVPASEGQAAAEALGISVATLRRAKRALSVKSRREGYGKEGRWSWVLPSSPPGP